MEKIPMTPAGLAALEEELKRLKTVDRPDVIRAIAEAREHGDLSENAEYHAARERQSFIEGRISELEDIVSRAEVIDITKMSGHQIRFGAGAHLGAFPAGQGPDRQAFGRYRRGGRPQRG
ncbi:MAG: transcription elongation factor GreA [Rhodospirillaceae bacterium]|nr:MAG: transcription elongation factor GreA [Rhodospirillaceae bacterium]